MGPLPAHLQEEECAAQEAAHQRSRSSVRSRLVFVVVGRCRCRQARQCQRRRRRRRGRGGKTRRRTQEGEACLHAISAAAHAVKGIYKRAIMLNESCLSVNEFIFFKFFLNSTLALRLLKFLMICLSPSHSPCLATDFPPARRSPQVDLALESGEYFLSQQQRDQRAREEGAARQIEQKRNRTIERAAEFIAPSVCFSWCLWLANLGALIFRVPHVRFDFARIVCIFPQPECRRRRSLPSWRNRPRLPRPRPRRRASTSSSPSLSPRSASRLPQTRATTRPPTM